MNISAISYPEWITCPLGFRWSLDFVQLWREGKKVKDKDETLETHCQKLCLIHELSFDILWYCLALWKPNAFSYVGGLFDFCTFNFCVWAQGTLCIKAGILVYCLQKFLPILDSCLYSHALQRDGAASPIKKWSLFPYLVNLGRSCALL